MSEARDSLRAAIAAVEAAEIERSKSIAAYLRAGTMLSAAEAEVASFDDLDDAVAAHNAGKLKDAIASGAAAPDLSKLPDNLATRFNQRATAIEKLKAIRSVHSELGMEANAADITVERKKYELELAVEAVVAEDAKLVADAWLAGLAELQPGYWLIAALIGRRIRIDPSATRSIGDSGYRPFNFDLAVRKAAATHSIIGDAELMHGPVARESAAVRVGEFIQALHKDPSATL